MHSSFEELPAEQWPFKSLGAPQFRLRADVRFRN